MNEWTQAFISSVELLAEPLLRSEGMTLIDVEYRRERNGWILRVIIDKDGGVTLQDCIDISSQLGDLLDAKTDLEGPYHLEVSSPGLDRPLRAPKHFIHFQGCKALIKTSKPVDGKRRFRGILGRYSDGVVELVVKERAVPIPYEAIVKARLDY
jgi:ribosome maturation factor RimP